MKMRQRHCKARPGVASGGDPLRERGKGGKRIPSSEQDNAPSGAANPGQSLAFAELSYTPLRNLREVDDDERLMRVIARRRRRARVAGGR
jgi:hypothetical protein